ncbi:MAG: hypothetical protein WCB36_11810 [Burkholderiales bacterium]
MVEPFRAGGLRLRVRNAPRNSRIVRSISATSGFFAHADRKFASCYFAIWSKSACRTDAQILDLIGQNVKCFTILTGNAFMTGPSAPGAVADVDDSHATL